MSFFAGGRRRCLRSPNLNTPPHLRTPTIRATRAPRHSLPLQRPAGPGRALGRGRCTGPALPSAGGCGSALQAKKPGSGEWRQWGGHRSHGSCTCNTVLRILGGTWKSELQFPETPLNPPLSRREVLQPVHHFVNNTTRP